LPDTSEEADGQRKIWLLVGGILLVAGGLHLGLVSGLQGPANGSAVPWWALALGFLVAEACVVHVHFGREAHSFALGEIPLVLGLFLADPNDLVSARLAASLVVLALGRRQPVVKLLFNLAQWWLGSVVALAVWRGLGGMPGEVVPRGWLAAIAAVALSELVATAVIVLAIRLREGRLPSGVLVPGLFTGQLVSLTNVSFALVTFDVLHLDWRGAWALLVLAATVLSANRAYVGLHRRHRLLERLNEFTRDVGTELHLRATAEDVLTKVRELLDARTATLTLDDTFAGHAVGYRCDADGVHDVNVVGVPAALPDGPRRSLQVTLRSDGRAVGSLGVTDRLGDVSGFGSDDIRLLQAVAGHATVSLRNSRLADLLRETARESKHQALHDPLTGLPNRLHFARAIDEACARGRTVVLLLDLDRFKEVNDTLGHSTGDDLLKEVAARLTSIVEGGCVARLGGDEFGVLIEDAGEAEGLAEAASIRAMLLAPLPLSAISFTMEASIGIALSPEHGIEAHSLLRHADVAMYVAKNARSAAEVYAADSDVNSERRLALVSEMRAALASDGFRLHYQPKASLRDGRVVGVEALIRWMHPVRGMVPPDQFIPVAEHVGLIQEITTWVLTTALAQCRSWHDAGLRLSIAVNVSATTLHDDGFPAALRALLVSAGVEPRTLTLEITEGAIMRNPEHALHVLGELRDLGVRLSIDDLGVGQSSLTYLRQLPVHEVKIDKSFVSSMTTVPDDDAIVSALVDLVHNLRLSVAAEGIETEPTWHRLAEIGCDTAQGYWLGRPVEAERLTTWLAEWDARYGLLPVGAAKARGPDGPPSPRGDS